MRLSSREVGRKKDSLMNIQCDKASSGPSDLAESRTMRADGSEQKIAVGGMDISALGEILHPKRMIELVQIAGNSYSRSINTLPMSEML